MIHSLVADSNVAQVQQQSSQVPVNPAPQQNQQQSQAPVQSATAVQAESEYRSFTFGQRLTESLNERLKLVNAQKTYENYRPFNI